MSAFLRLRGMSLTKKPATAELIAWSKALLGSGRAEVHAQAVIRVAQTLLDSQADSAAVLGGLPQVGCLLKLREDWEKLRPKPSVA